MGRHCVAEGVETTGQFHALDNLGIDLYQGNTPKHPQSPTTNSTSPRNSETYLAADGSFEENRAC